MKALSVLVLALFCQQSFCTDLECVDGNGNPISNNPFGKDGECETYYQCSNGNLVTLQCGEGLAFDPSVGGCNWAIQVTGCEYIAGVDPSLSGYCRNDDDSPIDPPPLATRKPGTCDTYYSCQNGILTENTCPSGLVFNPGSQGCDWDFNSPECTPSTTPVSSTTPTPSITPTPLTTVTSAAVTTSTNGGVVTEPPSASPTSLSTPDSSVSTSTLKTTVVTTEVPVTIPGCTDEDGNPISNDPFPKEDDCSAYYQCANGVLSIVQCAEGLFFDPVLKVCNFPIQVTGPCSPVDPVLSGYCTNDDGTPIDPPPPLIRIPGTCDSYYYCANGILGEQTCLEGLVFNPIAQACDYESESPECTPGTTTTTEGPTTVGGGPPGATTVGVGPPGTTTKGGGPPGATTVGGGPPGTTTKGGGPPGATTVAGGPPGATTVAVGPPGATTVGVGLPGTTTKGGGPPGATTVGGGPPGTTTKGGGPPGATTVAGGPPGATTNGGGPPGATTVGVGSPGATTVAVGPPGSTTVGGGPSGTTTKGGGPPGATTVGGGPPGTTNKGGGPPGATTVGGGVPGATTVGVRPPGATTVAVGPPGATTVGVGPTGATTVGEGFPGATTVDGGPPGATTVGGGSPGATTVDVGPPGATTVGAGTPGATTVDGAPLDTTTTANVVTTTTTETQKLSYIGFVVDDTGSMSYEIVAVKEWITNCVNGGYSDCETPPTGGWLMTSFNDPLSENGPVVGPTTDVDVIIDAIGDLYAHGGGDCPEYAFTGLLNAVSAIPDDAGSCKMYFYSDATAKDFYLKPDTEEMFEKKGCTFIPLLTGCCGTCADPCESTNPEYCINHVVDDTTSSRKKRSTKSDAPETLYYTLASATGGTIFLTDKPSSPDEMLDFLEEEMTLGFCPTDKIAGPPPNGYTNEDDCNLMKSCWDGSVSKCYCMSETEPCPDKPIQLEPECPQNATNVLLADPANCTLFYQCNKGEMWHKQCAPGTVFDTNINNCNHPYRTAPPCGSLVTEEETEKKKGLKK